MPAKKNVVVPAVEPEEWVEQKSDYVVIDGVLTLRREVEKLNTATPVADNKEA